jgi:hypothetical protein
MEWIYISPVETGEYVVTTITPMGNFNVLLSYWNGKRWNFSNQTFVKYLKE